jgi:uncharacterized membrane protein YphA (DoxX/SURF4 family)
MEKKNKKIIVEICRVFLGLVFVFSGFVKAVDPWGSAYKNLEYFLAFGLQKFDAVAIPFAFFQIAVEFGLGICLLLGVYRRYTSLLSLVFMLIMTPLTLYLAIANPITDCGCFGDALVITNWQTFFKNLFLLTAAFVVFFWYRSITAFFSYKSYSVVSLWILIFILGVSSYCYTYLPLLDFRPYKPGANISQLMEIPEDAEPAVYETTLIYSKNGKNKAFTIDNYPKEGEGWTFVDSKSKLLKKGYEPPIHDFSITTENGDDITADVLSNPSYTFLLIAHRLEDANDTNADKINEIYDFSKIYGYDFYALTSSLSAEIKEWTNNTGAEYPFCAMDDIPLKTIIRSNPGLLLIKDGIIINKWPNKRLPGTAELANALEESELGKIPVKHNSLKVLTLALILVVPLLLIFWVDYSDNRRRRRKEAHRRAHKDEKNTLLN